MADGPRFNRRPAGGKPGLADQVRRTASDVRQEEFSLKQCSAAWTSLHIWQLPAYGELFFPSMRSTKSRTMTLSAAVAGLGWVSKLCHHSGTVHRKGKGCDGTTVGPGAAVEPCPDAANQRCPSCQRPPHLTNGLPQHFAQQKRSQAKKLGQVHPHRHGWPTNPSISGREAVVHEESHHAHAIRPRPIAIECSPRSRLDASGCQAGGSIPTPAAHGVTWRHGDL